MRLLEKGDSGISRGTDMGVLFSNLPRRINIGTEVEIISYLGKQSSEAYWHSQPSVKAPQTLTFLKDTGYCEAASVKAARRWSQKPVWLPMCWEL